MQTCYDLYKKKGKTLNSNEREAFESDLAQLDQALLREDQESADILAKKVESFSDAHFKKSIFDYLLEMVFALILALVIATIVRSMWFEPYEIPTGSMRPTFEEQDHLTVSKLAFGINIPLQTKHFYFDPDLVQRTSIVIFSGDRMPFIDADTTNFWVIPYKKRYIKRAMGKPGDTVYFYGGKLYSLDKEGHLVTELLDSPWMHRLEHIPFLSFEGRVSAPDPNHYYFNQMHMPIGRLSITPNRTILGEIFNGKDWIKDQPTAQKQPHTSIQTYSDFWGMRNFAMARLLTKEQLKLNPSIPTEGLEDGVLYLQLNHTPSLSNHRPRSQDESQGYSLIIPYSTVIPLQQQHLDAILNNMYTARFVVSNGHARRYSIEDAPQRSRNPSFPDVPDGTYEFYFGKAYKVGWGGILTELPKDHPLYTNTPKNIQKLYNLGIEIDTAFSTKRPNSHFPQRYAYFRDGDLYLLGEPILKKDDTALIAFKKRELEREEKSTKSRPYVAFKDYGPPLLEDGTPNKEFIRAFGLTIPSGQYLVLGDNHAMSSDSRVFGFVPQDNLQGAPSLIIWPPGDRLGRPEQKPYPLFNLPRLIVWSIVLLIVVLWYCWNRYKKKRPIFKKLPLNRERLS